MPDSPPRADSVLAPDVDLGAQPAAVEAPAAHAPPPDIEKTREALREDVGIRSLAITGLFLLALCYTLSVARAFFLPIVFAILLDLLFSPVVRSLKRAGLPTPLGGLFVVIGFVATLGLATYELVDPVQTWMTKAPGTLSAAGTKLRQLRRPVEQVSRTAEQVATATQVAPPTRAPAVVVQGPSVSQRVFGTTQSLLTGLLEVIVLLYFLLAAGDFFLQKVVKVMPLLSDRQRAVSIARDAEAGVSTYLFTVTLVNIGEGVVVAGAMALLGMPNPVLWGVLVALLEYVPYIGAATMVGILSIAALSTFPALGRALAVPATFLTINFLQANFITPLVLGRRLTLNPVAILIGVLFWWRLWGVAGAFVAVPLLATLKIFCDHSERLAPLGEFLGK